MTSSPTMMDLAQEYLALRRQLGYALVTPGKALLSFARYADSIGHRGPITIDLAVRWAKLLQGVRPSWWARRLQVVRGFAQHRRKTGWLQLIGLGQRLTGATDHATTGRPLPPGRADRIPSMLDGRQAGKSNRKGAPGWPGALMMGAVLLFSPAPLLAQAAPRHVGPPADLFLRRWLLLGPIALSNGKALDEEAQRKAFDFDALAGCGGETQLFASTPAACTIGNRELQWKPINSADDVVNLGIELGPKDYAVAYALADLESPSATSVVAGLGSDDAVKVWLNGKPVHRNWTMRGHSKDQDNLVLPLQPGRNTLLLKIYNERLDWAFSLRALGPQGLRSILWQATREGDLEKMRMVLGQGRSLRINTKTTDGLTAWQLAKLFGRSEAAELLARNGANTTLPVPKSEAIIDSNLSEVTSGPKSIGI